MTANMMMAMYHDLKYEIAILSPNAHARVPLETLSDTNNEDV